VAVVAAVEVAGSILLGDATGMALLIQVTAAGAIRMILAQEKEKPMLLRRKLLQEPQLKKKKKLPLKPKPLLMMLKPKLMMLKPKSMKPRLPCNKL